MGLKAGSQVGDGFGKIDRMRPRRQTEYSQGDIALGPVMDFIAIGELALLNKLILEDREGRMVTVSYAR